MKFFSPRLPILLASALLAVSCSPTEAAPHDSDTGAATQAVTLYLVRHAEKQDGDNPALTEDGVARADALADRLEDAGIEAVWSTDYRRTMQTAQPLADRLGLDVQVYDPSDLSGFADQLQADGETALVVGHSNTTPQLAGLLGGDPGPEIVEASEYDRLYVISGLGSETTQSEIERYGVPSSTEVSAD